MTNEKILDICRHNWQYRGVDETSVREMLAELAEQLRNAEDEGRPAREVVGEDVRSFAASWARARTPLPRRALRVAALASFAVAMVLSASFLIQTTTRLPVTADRIGFLAAFAVVLVFLETRYGGQGFIRCWGLGIIFGIPAGLLADWLLGEEALFVLPIWALPALYLPGLPYAIADTRARRKSPARPA